MAKSSLTVTLNVQQMYDQAKAARDAFAAMVEHLRETADVCDHPEGQRTTAYDGKVEACRVCDTIIRDDSKRDGDR